MRPWLKYSLLIYSIFNRLLFGAEEGKVPPPKPYVFSLGSLTPKQIEEVRTVPGIVEVSAGERTRVVWQPFNDGPWKPDGSKFIKGAERIYDFLAIKKRLGETVWTHGGIFGHNSSTIITYGPVLSGSKGVPKVFCNMFNDLKSHRNEVMSIVCYSDSEPGQLEHEMLRGLIGLPITVQPCANGFVLVANGNQELRVAWQVSDQIYATIDFSFDKEMAAAFIDRLGCITTKDYKVSLDKWVEEEIRWRMKQLDFDFQWSLAHGIKNLGFLEHLYHYFPETGQTFKPPGKESTPLENLTFLNSARNFLWANRANFKYQPSAGWYVLKGKDLYDPEHPPELPIELRGPSKPTQEEIRTWEAIAQETARQDLQASIRSQFAVWDSMSQWWLIQRNEKGNLAVTAGFNELEERMKKYGFNLTWQQAQKWLVEAKGWLWANRDNFERRNGSYFLKGPDLYDPAHPPELPEDLRSPPQPGAVQKP